MAGLTLAGLSGGYPGMVIAFYLEAGGTAVASVTGIGGLNVVDWLWCSTDTAAGGVTSRAILGGVFEYAIQVALLAAQSGMHIFQDESGFGVIEQHLGSACCSMSEGWEANCHAQQQDPYHRADHGINKEQIQLRIYICTRQLRSALSPGILIPGK